jgi:hypothetical protein
MMKLKQSLYYVFGLMVGLFTLSGCIEEYEADISSEDSDLLVVEGSICSSKLNKFILTRTLPVNSTLMPPIVHGASVSVRGSDGSEYRLQETGDCYTCQIDTLYPDVAYYLHIETDGEVYESDPQKPLPTETVAEVSAMQDTPESNIDVFVTPEAPFDPSKVNFYTWTYDETWEVHPDYTTVIYFDTKILMPVYDPHQFPTRGWKNARSSTIMVGTSLNYEGQHIRGFKLYDIDRTHERMYYKYSGMVHQRAISKAEYEYELARRQAGSEMGGLFTPQPSALPTNIHCLTSRKHVIGFVGCSLNTSEYRFFLHRKDFSIYHPIPKDARKWLDDCNEGDCYRMVEKEGMFLCEWKDERYRPDGTLQTAWAYDYQLDVRLRGAYAEEPDFWSLDELNE